MGCSERWNIHKTGLIYGAPGIDRSGRWREDGPALKVTFDRAMFGGPDTMHHASEPFEALPFFEPIPDWD